MAKTLEEIEAIHAARAARKSPTPQDDGETDPVDPDDVLQQTQPVSDLEAELAKLRQQYSALQGRLTPAQQQMEEFKRLYELERANREAETNRLQAERDALREQLADRDSPFDPADFLSEEERNMFDDETINLVAKVARAAAKAAAPTIDIRTEVQRVREELAAQKIADYRNAVINDPSKGLSSLHQLANDPEFNGWLEQEGNEDFEPLVRSLFQAQSTRDIDRLGKAVAKRIAKYQGSAPEATHSRQTDARTSLDRAVQRRPRQLSNSDVERKLNEAKQLARSRNPEDRKRAAEIINSL